MTTSEILENAKRIKNTVAFMSTEQKNAALIKMAEAIEEEKDAILRANNVDLNNMQGIMSDVMLDRLALSEQRIRSMAENMRAMAKIPDPIGVTLEEY